MIAVIFEVDPKSGHQQQYLELAASLRAQLDQIDGFLSMERFQSLADENKILSLSFFRDEDAIAEWRKLQAHRSAQAKGRETIFADYRLRIASVVRDYGMFDRDQAPKDSREAHHR